MEGIIGGRIYMCTGYLQVADGARNSNSGGGQGFVVLDGCGACKP